MTLLLVEEGVTFSGTSRISPDHHSLYRDGRHQPGHNYGRPGLLFFSTQERTTPALKLGVYGRSGRKGKGTIYPINLPAYPC